MGATAVEGPPRAPTALPPLTAVGEFADPVLEDRFLRWRLATGSRSLSIGALVAAVAFVAFIPTDRALAPSTGAWLVAAAARLLAGAAMLGAAWTVRRRPLALASRAGRVLLLALQITCGAAVLVVSVVRPAAAANLHVAVVLTGTAALVVIPGPIRLRAAGVAAQYVAFGAIVASRYDPALVEPLPLFGSLAAALAGGVATGVHLNRTNRLAYAGMELEQRLNAELAAKVEEAESLRHELVRTASEDVLTGLPNRRAFFAAGAEVVRTATGPVSVVVFDIDDFKSINDRFGHAAGDVALQAVAATLRATLRARDVPGRIGGEEFAVVLRGGIAGVTAVAARVREAIASTPVVLDGELIGLTVSVGLATRVEDEDLDAVLRRADLAMYDAKRSGGNALAVS